MSLKKMEVIEGMRKIERNELLKKIRVEFAIKEFN